MDGEARHGGVASFLNGLGDTEAALAHEWVGHQLGDCHLFVRRNVCLA
jgi:hypothetical protein